ncbi:reverse transcriptase domain-containing protein [Tanacetum coccineum]|uniref:Reverse transcriptase domain-containing protein n=1 Tax=Tanacetum coccineum TaxID=301880 RepID=A0ABQ4Z4S9_9ASTR
MVKKVDDMTIAEYIEYEERMKRQYSRNSGSYFLTYSGHCTSSNNTTIEFPRNIYFNPIQPNTEFYYDYEDMELDEETGYTTDEESVMSKHKAIDPAHVVNTQSFEEELSSEEDLDGWLKAKTAIHKNKQISASEADLKKSYETIEDTINNDSCIINLPYQPLLEELNLGSFLLPFTIDNYNSYVKMDDMKQQETLGAVKNVLVKFDKFEFPCDFVVTDMHENLREMIILGRLFLETIHAQIDVFQEEISLGIGKDRIKFDVNGNPRQSKVTIKKVYMANTSQEEESFDPLEIGHHLFSYESFACLQFEQDT